MCVISTALIACGPTPEAARRITTARPQSIRMLDPPAFTSVAGPARSGWGIGVPVPSKMTSIAPPSALRIRSQYGGRGQRSFYFVEIRLIRELDAVLKGRAGAPAEFG